MGRFKEDRRKNIGEALNFIPCAARTQSHLNPWWWTLVYVQKLEQMGINRGWGIRDPQNLKRRGKTSDFTEAFYSKLEEVQLEAPHLIPETLDVRYEYGFARSVRRGSKTHAGNMNVSPEDIDLQNHWASILNDGGKKFTQKTATVYTEFRQALPSLLRYSEAL